MNFSLGIDTLGGVKVPTAFRGIIRFRPSYGVVSHTEIILVSSSLDTVGLFAKDSNILHRVDLVLLQLPFLDKCNPKQILLADGCFQLLKIPMDRVLQLVINSIEKHIGRQVLKHANLENYFSSKVPSLKEFYSQKINGDSKFSSIRLLANVAEFLQRYVFKCMQRMCQILFCLLGAYIAPVHFCVGFDLHGKDYMQVLVVCPTHERTLGS